MIEDRICLPEKLIECETHISLLKHSLLRTDPKNEKKKAEINTCLKEAIRLAIQLTEMLSWANYLFTKESLGNKIPTCEDIILHYLGKESFLSDEGKIINDPNSGSFKFRKKWPEIWDDINSCKPEVEKLLGHEATYADLYFHFKKQEGIVLFWKKHPDDLFSSLKASA